MNTNQYTQKTIEAIQAAQQLAVEYQHNALEPRAPAAGHRQPGKRPDPPAAPEDERGYRQLHRRRG